MKLVFLRHGQAQHNLLGWSGNIAMAKLTPVGRRAVTASAQQLSQFKFAAIYTSPLVRARQTAEIVAQHQPETTKVQIDGRLADTEPTPPNYYRRYLGAIRSKLRSPPNAGPGPANKDRINLATQPTISFIEDLHQQRWQGPVLAVGHLVTFWTLIGCLGEASSSGDEIDKSIDLAGWIEFETKGIPLAPLGLKAL